MNEKLCSSNRRIIVHVNKFLNGFVLLKLKLKREKSSYFFSPVERFALEYLYKEVLVFPLLITPRVFKIACTDFKDSLHSSAKEFVQNILQLNPPLGITVAAIRIY